MVRKPSASSASSPPPSYSSFSGDSRFVPSRRTSSGADSVFTDQSTFSISKYEARAAIRRHASTKRKYSTKAAEKMRIKDIETYTIWHDCLETVKEHRFKTTKQKPYKGNLSAGSRLSTGKIPNIWEMKVPYCNDQETKYYVIPHTSRIEKCSGCSGKGEEICYNCSGAGSRKCWYCHGNGMTDVTGHRYETNHYTNEQELVRHVTQETCHHCGGGGYSTCHTCGGRRANECRLCDGNGKMEKYSRLEVSGERKCNNVYHGTTVLPEKVARKHLPKCRGEPVYQKSKEGAIDPITSTACDNKTVLETSEDIFRQHRRWSKGSTIRKQRETLREIVAHEVWYDIDGNIASFWVIGDEQFVYAPNCPRSFKPECTIM